MSLPKVALPASSVELAGERVEFHSLSRSEVLQIQKFENDPDGAEDFILACGTGISVEEAHEWRGTTDVATAGLLVDAIIELSGLTGPKEEAAAPLKAVK